MAVLGSLVNDNEKLRVIIHQLKAKYERWRDSLAGTKAKPHLLQPSVSGESGPGLVL